MRNVWFAILLVSLAGTLGAEKPAALPPPELKLRLATQGWGDASLTDVDAVLHSAGRQVLANFPGAKLDPIQVQPRGGPITLFKRSRDGSIVIKLDTSDRRWAQYSFQFGHELCHVMCRTDDNDTGNLWFEESLCELSSLYTLRRMGDEWKIHPPYPSWKSYAPHLTEYAQQRIDDHPLPKETTLAQWYRDNAEALRKNATDRDRNTVVAAALLPIFENEPTQWAAVQFLNQAKPREKQTFTERLQNWHDQSPAENRPFIRTVAMRFEIQLKAEGP
jgi:hypothetical protein